MTHAHRHLACRAFTLVELLVTIVIIGALLALLLPAVQAAREAAGQVRCRNNLKQLGLALQNYEGTFGALPPALAHNSKVSPETDLESGWWSWTARILPFLEQKPLHDSLGVNHDAVQPFLNGTNCPDVSQNLNVLLCPADPYSKKKWHADWNSQISAAHSNYLGCRGSTRRVPGDGIFPATNHNVRLKDISDGLSNTLLVGERPIDKVGEWGWWAMGTGFDGHGFADHVLDCEESLRRGVLGESDDLTHYWSLHPQGAYFVLADGSVHFLRYSINRETFQALGSRDGGETIGEF